MALVTEVLKSSLGYIGGTGREDVEIRHAETQLNTQFAPDYRCYLSQIGLACYDGHELTGICKDKRLNVVDVTVEERAKCPECSTLYVIEQANIDGIVIWQAPSGEIYQTTPNTTPQLIYSSLAEYISG